MPIATAERFSNRQVLVTGASRGLGAAIAAAFGAEGATVWVGYRVRDVEANAVVSAIRDAGGVAHPVCIDVRDPAAVAAAFAEITRVSGALDVLVNNAAISRDGHFAMLDDDAWCDVIETNLNGTARCSRAAVTSMWRAQRGAIVNVASVSGPLASPGQAAYAASKGGVLALTRTLAAELAPRGIRVNAVVPGFIDAGMTTRLDHRALAERTPRIPLARLGSADEVARVVLFLASDDASYIVGQALFVDGGLSL